MRRTLVVLIAVVGLSLAAKLDGLVGHNNHEHNHEHELHHVNDHEHDHEHVNEREHHDHDHAHEHINERDHQEHDHAHEHVNERDHQDHNHAHVNEREHQEHDHSHEQINERDHHKHEHEKNHPKQDQEHDASHTDSRNHEHETTEQRLKIQTDTLSHEEQAIIRGTDPATVRGSYSWTAPNGETFVVEYIADERGYRPIIHRGRNRFIQRAPSSTGSISSSAGATQNSGSRLSHSSASTGGGIINVDIRTPIGNSRTPDSGSRFAPSSQQAGSQGIGNNNAGTVAQFRSSGTKSINRGSLDSTDESSQGFSASSVTQEADNNSKHTSKGVSETSFGSGVSSSSFQIGSSGNNLKSSLGESKPKIPTTTGSRFSFLSGSRFSSSNSPIDQNNDGVAVILASQGAALGTNRGQVTFQSPKGPGFDSSSSAGFGSSRFSDGSISGSQANSFTGITSGTGTDAHSDISSSHTVSGSRGSSSSSGSSSASFSGQTGNNDVAVILAGQRFNAGSSQGQTYQSSSGAATGLTTTSFNEPGLELGSSGSKFGAHSGPVQNTDTGVSSGATQTHSSSSTGSRLSLSTAHGSSSSGPSGESVAVILAGQSVSSDANPNQSSNTGSSTSGLEFTRSDSFHGSSGATAGSKSTAFTDINSNTASGDYNSQTSSAHHSGFFGSQSHADSSSSHSTSDSDISSSLGLSSLSLSGQNVEDVSTGIKQDPGLYKTTSEVSQGVSSSRSSGTSVGLGNTESQAGFQSTSSSGANAGISVLGERVSSNSFSDQNDDSVTVILVGQRPLSGATRQTSKTDTSNTYIDETSLNKPSVGDISVLNFGTSSDVNRRTVSDQSTANKGNIDSNNYGYNYQPIGSAVFPPSSISTSSSSSGTSSDLGDNVSVILAGQSYATGVNRHQASLEATKQTGAVFNEHHSSSSTTGSSDDSRGSNIKPQGNLNTGFGSETYLGDHNTQQSSAHQSGNLETQSLNTYISSGLSSSSSGFRSSGNLGTQSSSKVTSTGFSSSSSGSLTDNTDEGVSVILAGQNRPIGTNRGQATFKTASGLGGNSYPNRSGSSTSGLGSTSNSNLQIQSGSNSGTSSTISSGNKNSLLSSSGSRFTSGSTSGSGSTSSIGQSGGSVSVILGGQRFPVRNTNNQVTFQTDTSVGSSDSNLESFGDDRIAGEIAKTHLSDSHSSVSTGTDTQATFSSSHSSSGSTDGLNSHTDASSVDSQSDNFGSADTTFSTGTSCFHGSSGSEVSSSKPYSDSTDLGSESYTRKTGESLSVILAGQSGTHRDQGSQTASLGTGNSNLASSVFRGTTSLDTDYSDSHSNDGTDGSSETILDDFSSQSHSSHFSESSEIKSHSDPSTSHQSTGSRFSSSSGSSSESLSGQTGEDIAVILSGQEGQSSIQSSSGGTGTTSSITLSGTGSEVSSSISTKLETPRVNQGTNTAVSSDSTEHQPTHSTGSRFSTSATGSTSSSSHGQTDESVAVILAGQRYLEGNQGQTALKQPAGSGSENANAASTSSNLEETGSELNSGFSSSSSSPTTHGSTSSQIAGIGNTISSLGKSTLLAGTNSASGDSSVTSSEYNSGNTEDNQSGVHSSTLKTANQGIQPSTFSHAYQSSRFSGTPVSSGSGSSNQASSDSSSGQAGESISVILAGQRYLQEYPGQTTFQNSGGIGSGLNSGSIGSQSASESGAQDSQTLRSHNAGLSEGHSQVAGLPCSHSSSAFRVPPSSSGSSSSSSINHSGGEVGIIATGQEGQVLSGVSGSLESSLPTISTQNLGSSTGNNLNLPLGGSISSGSRLSGVQPGISRFSSTTTNHGGALSSTSVSSFSSGVSSSKISSSSSTTSTTGNNRAVILAGQGTGINNDRVTSDTVPGGFRPLIGLTGHTDSRGFSSLLGRNPASPHGSTSQRFTPVVNKVRKIPGGAGGLLNNRPSSANTFPSASSIPTHSRGRSEGNSQGLRSVAVILARQGQL